MNPILSIFKPIAGLGKSWIEGRQKLQVARVEAEVLRMMRQAEAEAEWDLEALRQMQFSWKDEYILLLITAPIWYAMGASAFFPHRVPHVERFFAILDTFPEWWNLSFMGIVAASFGLRWLVARDKKQVAEKIAETRGA